MGQRPCSCPFPSPAPLCLTGVRGPGFRVRSLPPPRSRGFPLRPAGEKERLSRRSSPSSAPGSNTPQVCRQFCLGRGISPFPFSILSSASHCFWKMSLTGQLMEVIFTSLLRALETAELGGQGAGRGGGVRKCNLFSFHKISSRLATF